MSVEIDAGVFRNREFVPALEANLFVALNFYPGERDATVTIVAAKTGNTIGRRDCLWSPEDIGKVCGEIVRDHFKKLGITND